MGIWSHGDGAMAREGLLVRRLIDQGLRDPRVLAAFARVPREFFVPEEYQGEAQADRPLDIGWGQTISQPYVVAAMVEALDLTGRERLLEVGTGSGYATAILAEMMPVSAAIRSIEIIPDLASRARRVFDAILVSAAPPEVPPALLAQLASGGRMVLPVGRSPEQQELQLWRRAPAGGFEKRTLMQVRFVPLTGSSQHNLH